MVDTTDITKQRALHQQAMNHWYDVSNSMRKLLAWLIGVPLWTIIVFGAFIGSSFLVGAGWALLVFFVANLLCGIALVSLWLLFAKKAHAAHSTWDAQLEQVQRRSQQQAEYDTNPGFTEQESLIIDVQVTQDACPLSKV